MADTKAVQATNKGVREADIDARFKVLRERKSALARQQLKIAAGKIQNPKEKKRIESEWKDVNRQLSNLQRARSTEQPAPSGAGSKNKRGENQK